MAREFVKSPFFVPTSVSFNWVGNLAESLYLKMAMGLPASLESALYKHNMFFRKHVVLETFFLLENHMQSKKKRPERSLVVMIS